MVIKVATELDPSGRFQKALKKAGKSVQDLTVPLSSIRASWFRSNNAIFSLQGAGQYPDLSELYKIEKQKAVGFVYPILQRSGDLKKSITNPSDSKAIGKIESDKQTLTLGTKVAYGVYHQSKQPRTKMPYRPFLFAGAEQVAPNEINKRVSIWVEIIEDWVEQVTSSVGDMK